MSLLSTSALDAARARLATEDALHRQARLALRGLWTSAQQLEASTSPSPSADSLAALRREALRQATRVLPFPALVEGADAMRALGLLVEQGLDGVPPGEVQPLLALARTAHARALESLEAPLAELDALVRRRQVALGTLVVTVALFASLTGRVLYAQREPVDLAAGKPFTLSSKWADCHPEKNECGGYPTHILFHTNQEPNPWYQVDLGAPTTFSSASLINRQDMAMALAVPLVLEVSDDGASWREVIRRGDVFSTWYPTFPPQKARYLRVRVDRISTLHLEAVRVHP